MATTAASQSISGVGSALIPTSSASSGTSAASSLNANSFLTMFLAQLQNQDPTDPMESYELAAQLAQFTTVQLLTQASTQLGNIQQYSAAINNVEMASLVGKNVMAQSSETDVSSGTPTALSYTLPAQATVSYTIQDSNGNTVYSGSIGSQNAGTYSIPWNGKDSSGNTVADGAYTCNVTAVAADGTSSTVQTFVQGVVYSLNLNNPATYLLTGPGGITVQVSNVLGVSSS